MSRRSQVALAIVAALVVARVAWVVRIGLFPGGERESIAVRADAGIARVAADVFGFHDWVLPRHARFVRGRVAIEGDVPEDERLELVLRVVRPETGEVTRVLDRIPWPASRRDFSIDRPPGLSALEVSIEGRYVHGALRCWLDGGDFDYGEMLRTIRAEVGGCVALEPRFIGSEPVPSAEVLSGVRITSHGGSGASREHILGDSIELRGCSVSDTAVSIVEWPDAEDPWVVPCDFSLRPVAGQTVRRVLPLVRARRVEVRFLNTDGSAVVGASVVVMVQPSALERESGSAAALAQTDHAGRAVVACQPGRLTWVECEHPESRRVGRLAGSQAEGWDALAGAVVVRVQPLPDGPLLHDPGRTDDSDDLVPGPIF